MVKTYYVASWHTNDEYEGVTRIVYDKENDVLYQKHLATDTKRTSYFARDNDLLYVLTEGQVATPNSSKVTSFKMNQEGLQQISCSDNFDSAAPHIMLTSNKKTLYVSGYLTGALFKLDVDENGNLSALKKVYENFGCSISPRQTSSHLHFAIETPEKEYICVCDLGTDEVLVFKVNQDNGQLTKTCSIKTPAGYGPRHMSFSKDGKYAYVLCELTYHLLVFAYEGNGYLEFVQDIDLWPECPIDARQCSAIKISEDGKYLFTCNRGKDHNSLDALSLTNLDNPVKIASFTDLSFPRDITLLGDGYIAICNQHGNNIQFVRFDGSSFKETGKVENVLEPVSIIEY